jgi:hypothetical protein
LAKIKNPQAYAAWLARKQMAQTQQQNVSAYDQGGVDEQTRQRLLQVLAQQAAYQEARSQQNAVPSDTGTTIAGDTASNQIFNGKSIFEGNIFK